MKEISCPVATIGESARGGMTVRVGKMGKSIFWSGGQEPGTTNWLARLRAQAPEMRVSKGAGFGTALRPEMRKKASWRASTARMEAGPGTRPGSVTAIVEARLMTAPMPTLVMMLASCKNEASDVTGKTYLQGSKVGALKWLRRFSIVCTCTSSCAITFLTTAMTSGEEPQVWVRFCSPAKKKADSRFSRKFAPVKPAIAVADIFAGGGEFGGAPPAMWATRAGLPRAKLVGSLKGAVGAEKAAPNRAREKKAEECISILFEDKRKSEY